jgi:hypothetical protein
METAFVKEILAAQGLALQSVAEYAAALHSNDQPGGRLIDTYQMQQEVLIRVESLAADLARLMRPARPYDTHNGSYSLQGGHVIFIPSGGKTYDLNWAREKLVPVEIGLKFLSDIHTLLRGAGVVQLFEPQPVG